MPMDFGELYSSKNSLNAPELDEKWTRTEKMRNWGENIQAVVEINPSPPPNHSSTVVTPKTQKDLKAPK